MSDDEEQGFDVDGLFTGPLAGKVVERDGLKTQDLSGQDIPAEVMEKFVDALIAAGLAVYNEDGNLKMLGQSDTLLGIDFQVDDDGNVTNVSVVPVEDVERDFKTRSH